MMRGWVISLAVGLQLFGLSLDLDALRPAAAAPPSPLAVEESVGFRDTIKVGKWLPVTVTLKNVGPPIRGILRVEHSTLSEGYPRAYTTTLSQVVDLPTQSRKRFSFVVMVRDFAHPLVMRLTDRAGAELYRREIDLRMLTSPDRLILVLSDEPALDSLAAVAPGKARVVYLATDEFPSRAEALDAVDLIAFRNLSLGTLRPEQLRAVRQWIARGGRLLITGGPTWMHYLHPSLRELAPVKVNGLTELNTLQGLDDLTGVASPGDVQMPILRSDVLGGRVLARSGEHPLLIVQEQGRGQVVFATFDPGRAPFTAWEGTSTLWKALFPLAETPNYWKLRLALRETFEETWIAQAMQLPLLSFPSHLLLAVFLILYASTMGVFFWLLELPSVSSRETWMLLTVALLAFIGAAHVLFRERHIEQDAILFDVSAVDVIPGSPFADLETHIALLSTRKQTYRVSVSGQSSTWQQVVPPAGHDLHLDWHLQYNDAVTIEDIPLQQWGLRVFKGRAIAEFPLETRVLREADSVMVRVTNKSGYLLRDCWLWRGPRIAPLGDIDDGEAAEGVLNVSRDEMARPLAQARWEKDLSQGMVRGHGIPTLLRRTVVERVMQEALRSESGWPNYVTFIGWLDQPLLGVSVKPGDITAHRATIVRMRLPL